MTKITVGTKVKLRGDVLVRHSRSVPVHMGFTSEQFAWRDALAKQEGKIGVVRFVFPNSNYVNVDFNGDMIGIDSTELLVKSGKGWKEAADETGKAPRHKAAATKRKVSGVSKVPMVRKEKDWKKVAKKELEKELGVKTKLSAYGNDDESQLTLESTTGAGSNGEREWVVFRKEDDARSTAIAQVKQDLEDSPENFTQDWLQNFITISDTDKRMIAGEEADDYVDNQMEDREDDLIKEADMESELEEIDNKITEAEDRLNEVEDEDSDLELTDDQIESLQNEIKVLESQKDKIIGQAKDKVRSDKQEEIERELEDPVKYFVDDHGIYSKEDLLKAPFIQIDIEKASEDAIDTDGIAHFLDRYDGSELELPSGAIAYGTN